MAPKTVLVALAWLGLGAITTCAHRRSSSGPQSVNVDDSETDDRDPPMESRTRTCSIDKPIVSERPLGALVALGVWKGRSWVMAKTSREGGRTPVLLHLDARGELVETDVPEFTEHADFEAPESLHFAEFGTATHSWHATIADSDVLNVTSAKKSASLLTLGDGGFDSGARVKGFAVFGERALISVYRHHYSGDGKHQSFGETALYERSSLRRLGLSLPFTTWQAQCGKTRCVGLATSNSDDDSASLIEVDEQGERHERLGGWGCSGWAHWRRGSKWLVAWLESGKLSALAYDFESGEKKRATRAAGNPGCAPLEAVEVAGRRGVVIAKQKIFVPIDENAQLGQPESIPEPSGRTQKYAPLPDGVLELDFTADRAMRHSPTDSRGSRRYHTEWSFRGRSSLLRRTERGLTRSSSVELPLSGTDGEFGDGVSVTPLVRGSYSAAIVSEGYRASIALLSRPCE